MLLAGLFFGPAAPTRAGAGAAPVVAGGGSVAPPARPRQSLVDRHLEGFSARADSAWARSRANGMAFADSLLRLGRARDDRSLRAAAHVWRGRKFANEYRLSEGQADLDTAWTLARALRDTAGLARVTAARGHGAITLGRLDDARREFDRLLLLTRAAGLPDLVGFAHRGLGYVAKQNGRYDEASRHLRDAIRLLPAERFEHRHSRFLLAEVRNRTGRHDEARTMFLELLDEARLRRDRWLEAAVSNDLGILEYGEGDMALADRYWAFAAAAFDSIGHAAAALSTNTNRAYALVRLERTGEARTLLERLRVEALRTGDVAGGHGVLTQMGELFRRIGRTGQAEELLRAVRASEVEDVAQQLEASLTLAELLRGAGRTGEAKALLDSLLAPASSRRLTSDDLAATRVAMSRVLRALGRPRAALDHARAAERITRTGRTSGSLYWLEAAIEVGRGQRESGTPDSAAATFKGAARAWERWRAEISDLHWRERQGSALADLFAQYGLALLDPRRGVPEPRRAREAFDALQVFQARTLEERMHAKGLSGRRASARVTADSLSRRVLRVGELLIDLMATPDTTIAFLVSRQGVEARLLPGARRLDRLHARWREALLAHADEDVARAGLERLSRELVAPLAEAIRGSRRIIVAGGGSLAMWPVAALTVPGESGPLGGTREVHTVPSATLLAALRRSGAGSGSGVLAVGRTTDAGGRELPGADRELRDLARRYAGTELRVNRGERGVAELTADLWRWDVLHFAAHAEAESGTPWRAGFLLGRGMGEDAYLRASSVADMKLRARLAVLSGCQSAGAATLAGEGALGLASAFLCSGTRSVVATLWPVEDRVAQRFVSEFYAALAGGATVAGAVGRAQSVLRSRSDTARVRDWAAFVAAGEGGTRVPLAPRRGTAP